MTARPIHEIFDVDKGHLVEVYDDLEMLMVHLTFFQSIFAGD